MISYVKYKTKLDSISALSELIFCNGLHLFDLNSTCPAASMVTRFNLSQRCCMGTKLSWQHTNLPSCQQPLQSFLCIFPSYPATHSCDKAEASELSASGVSFTFRSIASEPASHGPGELGNILLLLVMVLCASLSVCVFAVLAEGIKLVNY